MVVTEEGDADAPPLAEGEGDTVSPLDEEEGDVVSPLAEAEGDAVSSPLAEEEGDGSCAVSGISLSNSK